MGNFSFVKLHKKRGDIFTLRIEKVEEKLPIEEPPIVEDLTAAKADEIVITPEPVVPEIPKPKEEIVPNDVIYRIKWGDTLWDLA